MRDIDTEDYKKTGALLLKGLFGGAEDGSDQQDAKGIFARQLLRNGLIDSTAIPEPQFNQALYRYFKLNLTEFTNCAEAGSASCFAASTIAGRAGCLCPDGTRSLSSEHQYPASFVLQ